MSVDPIFSDLVDHIRSHDPRYAAAAYAFVERSVQGAITAVRHQESQGRHITADEIIESVAVTAEAEFGPLAEVVLQDWGIVASADIGNIVYHLIEARIFEAGPNDHPEHFQQTVALFDLIHHLRLPAIESKSPPLDFID